LSGPVIPFPTSRTFRDGQVIEELHITWTVPAWPDRRADRSELLAALVGAVVILAEVKDPIGRAYREGLVARIRSIIERENKALGIK
jgi:hypothetical protein